MRKYAKGFGNKRIGAGKNLDVTFHGKVNLEKRMRLKYSTTLFSLKVGKP